MSTAKIKGHLTMVAFVAAGVIAAGYAMNEFRTNPYVAKSINGFK